MSVTSQYSGGWVKVSSLERPIRPLIPRAAGSLDTRTGYLYFSVGLRFQICQRHCFYCGTVCGYVASATSH